MTAGLGLAYKKTANAGFGAAVLTVFVFVFCWGGRVIIILQEVGRVYHWRQSPVQRAKSPQEPCFRVVSCENEDGSMESESRLPSRSFRIATLALITSARQGAAKPALGLLTLPASA